MGKQYPDEFKNMVIREYLEGKNGGSKSLAHKYNISYHTIDTWIYKYKRQGNLDNDIYHKRGRKKESEIDYKERYEILKKYQEFIKAQREKK
jgi:transposase-like protein